jgi:hypothetical protein
MDLGGPEREEAAHGHPTDGLNQSPQFDPAEPNPFPTTTSTRAGTRKTQNLSRPCRRPSGLRPLGS